MTEKDLIFSNFKKRFLHYWWLRTMSKVPEWIFLWQDQTQFTWEIITEVFEKAWVAAGNQTVQEVIQEAVFTEQISVQIIPLYQ